MILFSGDICVAIHISWASADNVSVLLLDSILHFVRQERNV